MSYNFARSGMSYSVYDENCNNFSLKGNSEKISSQILFLPAKKTSLYRQKYIAHSD